MLSSIISACSDYHKDWPKLNSPLPKEEDRVHKRADASTSPAKTDTKVIPSDDSFSQQEWLAENAATRQDLLSHKKAYEADLLTLKKTSEATDRVINWRTAQLSLTRLSHSYALYKEQLATYSQHYPDAMLIAATNNEELAALMKSE